MSLKKTEYHIYIVQTEEKFIEEKISILVNKIEGLATNEFV